MFFLFVGCYLQDAARLAQGTSDPKDAGEALMCDGTLDAEGRIVVEGDVSVVTGFCADGCGRVITSDLTIGGEDEEGELSLDCIEEVEGAVEVWGTRLRSVSMPALRSVGTLSVSDNPWLEDVSFPALSRVARTVSVQAEGHVVLSALEEADGVSVTAASLDLASLVEVPGDLLVQGVAALDLPLLERVDGALSSTDGVSLDAPALWKVGTLTVAEEEVRLDALSRVDTLWVSSEVAFPALTNVGTLHLDAAAELPVLADLGDLYVEGTSLAALPAMPMLRTIGMLTIADNPVLADLSGLSGLTSVSMLTIRRNDALASVAFGTLAQTYLIELRDNPQLTTVAFDSLEIAAHVRLERVPLTSLDAFGRLPRLERLMLSELPLSSLEGLSGLEIVGTLSVSNMPDLLDLSGAPVRSVQILSVRNTGIVTLGLPLEEADTILLQRNPGLVDLHGLPAGLSLRALDIAGNGLVSTAGLAGIRSLESLRIADEMALLTLDEGPSVTRLESLTLKGGALISIPGLGTLSEAGTIEFLNTPLSDLDGLSAVAMVESLTLRNNDALRSLSGLGAVTGVDVDVKIDANRHLDDIEAFGPDWVGGSLWVINNRDLPTSAANALVDRVGLSDIRGDVTISGNGG